MNKIDYNAIKVLFLDVGNTLMSIDYEMVCRELERNGIHCDAGILHRADASARPIISSEVNKIKKDPSMDERVFLFTTIIEQLPIKIIKHLDSTEQVAHSLVSVLFNKENVMRLWAHVLPGTEEALDKFQAMGFKMHVIGNADGLLEQRLADANLRKYFGVVIDSHIVQIEKPDPRIFNIALEAANCEPQYALYAGDIYEVDIAGAESVGMQAVLVDPFSDYDNINCERVPDLLSLAEKLRSVKDQY
jgi:HAD superfamily hydrolase (TIGR01549 family)